MMKMTNKIGIVFIGVCVLLWLGSPIYAKDWTTMGGGCVPDDSSVNRVNLSSRFQHDTDIAGAVIARCNIVDIEGVDEEKWDDLVVTYNDPDGTGTDYRVTVSLYSVEVDVGQISRIAFFDSNDFDETRTEATVTFNHNFRFEFKAYYLYVVVIRADTAGAPAFIRGQLRP